VKTFTRSVGFPPDSLTLLATCVLLFVGLAFSAPAQALQQLHQRHSQVTKKLTPVERLDGNTRLDLAIGLPLRNRDKLTNLLEQLYQPSSPNFRHFLTPEQFTASFGPTEKDYESVINFAKSHELNVKRTHPNRTLLDVSGSVADIEKALHVHMRVYRHPTEARNFFAPDADPTVDLATPLLAISGLDSYVKPKPNIHVNLNPKVQPKVHPLGGGDGGGGGGGSGTGTYGYMGSDFQAAYTPLTLLDGTGQSIGLFELSGYATSDISDFIGESGVPGVPLQNVYVDGFDGDDSNPDFSVECTADIEIAMSMAPGLSQIYVYEGPTPENEPPARQLPATTAQINDTLNKMATDNLSRQLSCSYAMDINNSTVQIFQQFAAQGQSFFQASGDFGAYPASIDEPIDDPYITVVGGTALDTDTNGLWTDESVWLTPPGDPNYLNDVEWASGGGISLAYPIPVWQQGISMADNQGSPTMRNVPDVAAVAVNINIVWGEDFFLPGDWPVAGTSIAAPLWAGFMALVNQQAEANGQPPIGFANPALYAIGKSANYSSIFHDITEGDNTSPRSPSKYSAAVGYDLCTGWGTPNDPLIDALLQPPTETLVINPPFGFTSIGPGGGPFSVTSQTYTLTNIGSQSLDWNLGNNASWLTVSNTSGTLAPGKSTMVTVNFNSSVNNFLVNKAVGNVTFTNLTSGTFQDRQFDLYAGNGGFETGDLNDWTLVGNVHSVFPLAADDVEVAGTNALPTAPDEAFVRSGLYGGFLGEIPPDASLTHAVTTTASQSYVVSCWLTSVAGNGKTTPNHFAVKWNGATLFNQTNLPAFGWTNLQFTVPGASSSSSLEFDFSNQPGAFGLDDVTVATAAVSGPRESIAFSPGSNLQISWPLGAAAFHLQSSTDLANPNSWLNVNTPLTTNGNSVSTIVPIQSPQQFFRLFAE
jgi:subtilase family serine protease